MELMTDISACTIPLENVQQTISAAMAQVGIKALFQTEDVFNKKKRVILFDISMNLMDETQRKEIVDQTGLSLKVIDELLNDDCGKSVAGHLESLPSVTYETIIEKVSATSDTMELLQTLKTMGYAIGLISTASTRFV